MRRSRSEMLLSSSDCDCDVTAVDAPQYEVVRVFEESDDVMEKEEGEKVDDVDEMHDDVRESRSD